MQKGFWIVVVLAVAGMFGLFMLTSEDTVNTSFSVYDPAEVQLTDHIDVEQEVTTQEELDALLENKVVLIEYADFQCPACRGFFASMEQIKLDYGDQIVVVFRHFPLTNIHPQAMASHRAAEAAANQGAFWEMHDALYIGQDEWSGNSNASAVFDGYAVEIGLDPDIFTTDLASIEVFDRIDVDIDSASDFSISATPTLIVNGVKQETTPTYEQMKEIIDAEIAKLTN